MFRKNDQVISYEQLIEVGPPGLTAVVGSHGTRSCVGSTAIGPSGPFFDVHGHDGAGGFVKRGAPELRVLLPEQAPGMVPLLAVLDRPTAATKAHPPDLRPVLVVRSEEHTSELQSRPHLVCRLLLEKKKRTTNTCTGKKKKTKKESKNKNEIKD